MRRDGGAVIAVGKSFVLDNFIKLKFINTQEDYVK